METKENPVDEKSNDFTGFKKLMFFILVLLLFLDGYAIHIIEDSDLKHQLVVAFPIIIGMIWKAYSFAFSRGN